MTIDFHTDPWHAAKFSVQDFGTGANLDHMMIFFADDDRNLIRRYRTDARGYPYLEGDRLAWEEIERRVRIVPRRSTSGRRPGSHANLPAARRQLDPSPEEV